MAILSSNVVWPSTWRTRVATGAAECTHGQSVAAAAPVVAAPAAGPAPMAATTEQARVSAVTAAVRAPLMRFLAGIMGALLPRAQGPAISNRTIPPLIVFNFPFPT